MACGLTRQQEWEAAQRLILAHTRQAGELSIYICSNAVDIEPQLFASGFRQTSGELREWRHVLPGWAAGDAFEATATLEHIKHDCRGLEACHDFIYAAEVALSVLQGPAPDPSPPSLPLPRSETSLAFSITTLNTLQGTQELCMPILKSRFAGSRETWAGLLPLTVQLQHILHACKAPPLHAGLPDILSQVIWQPPSWRQTQDLAEKLVAMSPRGSQATSLPAFRDGVAGLEAWLSELRTAFASSPAAPAIVQFFHSIAALAQSGALADAQRQAALHGALSVLLRPSLDASPDLAIASVLLRDAFQKAAHAGKGLIRSNVCTGAPHCQSIHSPSDAQRCVARHFSCAMCALLQAQGSWRSASRAIGHWKGFPGLRESALLFISSYIAPTRERHVKRALWQQHLLAASELPVRAPPPSDEPWRVLIVTAHWIEAHAVFRTIGPFVQALAPSQRATSRSGLEVHLLWVESLAFSRASPGAAQEHIFASVHSIPANHSAADVHTGIQWARQRQADVAVFLSVGMHPLDTTLASHRLAPVQLTTYGHSASVHQAASVSRGSVFDLFMGGFVPEVLMEVEAAVAAGSHTATSLGADMKLRDTPACLQSILTAFQGSSSCDKALEARESPALPPECEARDVLRRRAHAACATGPAQAGHKAPALFSLKQLSGYLHLLPQASSLSTHAPHTPLVWDPQQGGAMRTLGACPATQQLSTLQGERRFLMLLACAGKVAAGRFSEQLLLVPGLGVAFTPFHQHFVPRPTLQQVKTAMGRAKRASLMAPGELRCKAAPGPVQVVLPWTAPKFSSRMLGIVSHALREAHMRAPHCSFQLLVAPSLPAGTHTAALAALMVSIRSSLGPGSEQYVSVRMRDALNVTAYLHHLSTADLAVDAYPYGGCNSILDAVHVGVPILTLAGSAWRNRIGAALLREVGLHETAFWEGAGLVSLLSSLLVNATARAELRLALAAAPLHRILSHPAGSPELRHVVPWLGAASRARANQASAALGRLVQPPSLGQQGTSSAFSTPEGWNQSALHLLASGLGVSPLSRWTLRTLGTVDHAE